MAVSIVMMSPKGGSGKTTLAISMANIFSHCHIKTLMIDCDFATNGASYFLLQYVDGDALTLNDIFKKGKATATITQIDEYFDFIPAILERGEDAPSDILINNINVDSKLGELEKKYEVIIYDCRAGKSNILHWIVKRLSRRKTKGDFVLSVMEYDKISEMALRDMQMFSTAMENKSGLISYRTIYNRVTQKEFNELKISTQSSNLYNIKNDESARGLARNASYLKTKEFSLEYKEQIYELCSRIVAGYPEMLNNLNRVKFEIEKERRSKRIDELNKEEEMCSKEVDKIKTKILYSGFVAVGLLFLLFLILGISIFAPNIMDLQPLIMFTVFVTSLFTGAVFILMTEKQKQSRLYKKIKNIQNIQEELKKEKNGNNN